MGDVGQGRPTIYSDDLCDRICALLAQGKSLRTICKSEDMPCVSTIFNWLRTNEDFLQQYTKAKEESADALVEEILDIADDGTNDWNETHDEEGKNKGWKFNNEHYQRSRLRVDARKWYASKLKPKKYGETLNNKLSTDDGTPLIVIKNYKSED